MDALKKTPRNSRKVQTYLPETSSQKEIIDFAEFMRDLESYLKTSSSKAALVDPAGNPRPIPDEIFNILEQVADALASGSGVTVAPYGMMMTTQQAADFLGVSRPTLVKMLEDHVIPFQQPGRHRRVQLRDLVEYKERFGTERQRALADLAAETPKSVAPLADASRVRRRSSSK